MGLTVFHLNSSKKDFAHTAAPFLLKFHRKIPSWSLDRSIKHFEQLIASFLRKQNKNAKLPSLMRMQAAAKVALA